ncbi:DUF2057 family protein [Vibrio sonorensis]|uniref:DUF2057 family protein n=1 Tax=Vibrio sonorensis TaxID=1004316 RepID=UPI0008D9B5E3|nr:DUF2057 family protein [Vibrio sonorensis]
MSLKKSLIAASILFSPLALSEVTVNIPEGVQVLVINGEDAGYSSFGFDYKENITVPNGVNQVVYRISKVVNDGGSKLTKFKSTPFITTFDESNSTLELELTELETLQQGRRFNSKPVLTMTNNGKEISSLKTDQLSTLLTFGSDYVQATENYNRTSEPASLAHYSETNVFVPQPIYVKKNQPVEVPVSKSVAELQQAFSNFSAQEKQEFMSWAIKNM